MIRTCPKCGAVFETKTNSRKYCSDNCSLASRYTLKTPTEKTCVICGKTFTSKNDKKYCSRSCYNIYYNALRKAAKENATERICPNCGKPFTFRQNNQVYCSEKCFIENRRKKNRKPAVEKNCIVCGKVFTTARASKEFCSEKCYNRWRWLNIRKKRQVEKNCLNCGKVFTTVYQNQRFCSGKCRQKWNYAQKAAPLIEKNCVICGKPFTTRRSYKICCSKKCSRQNNAVKTREYYLKKNVEPPKPKLPKIKKSAPLIEKNCIICGKVFTTRYFWKKCCSKECSRQHNIIMTREKYSKKNPPRIRKPTPPKIKPPKIKPPKIKNTGSAAQRDRLKDLLLQRRLEREIREDMQNDKRGTLFDT